MRCYTVVQLSNVVQAKIQEVEKKDIVDKGHI